MLSRSLLRSVCHKIVCHAFDKYLLSSSELIRPCRMLLTQLTLLLLRLMPTRLSESSMSQLNQQGSIKVWLGTGVIKEGENDSTDQ